MAARCLETEDMATLAKRTKFVSGLPLFASLKSLHKFSHNAYLL